ncbi:MAG: DUF6326 family protein [Caldilinea sp.]|nr:hypothetical protein [Caldilinea sp.]MCB0058104.1 hypothetical protein [Caldilineaceae bacterium]MCB0051981.1 hypothetical protein [Caldilinea sp.]MCB0068445.1 hypothetical protein [Caldilineaceae bacterium]MCB0152589.1 hypothetical protein [Caldilineaceae bacterium]
METIDTVQLRLTALWVALMLIYLLGDVLRIFSGDFKAGEIMGSQVTQPMWLGIAALMVIPILMIILTMTLGQGANRWLNIIVAVFFFLFNLVGLPTYPSWYDRFLLVVSLGFNVMTVWYAWKWQ